MVVIISRTSHDELAAPFPMMFLVTVVQAGPAYAWASNKGECMKLLIRGCQPRRLVNARVLTMLPNVGRWGLLALAQAGPARPSPNLGT